MPVSRTTWLVSFSSWFLNLWAIEEILTGHGQSGTKLLKLRTFDKLNSLTKT